MRNLLKSCAVGVLAASSLWAVGPASITHAADVATFHGLTPARLMDTRPASPTVDSVSAGLGKIGANATANLVVVGRGGVPAGGVGAVALNVTATNPTATGYLTVYPAGASRPTASNLNFTAGQTIPNMVLVPVGTAGQISVFNSTAGTTDVVVDVLGWFPTGPAFTGLTPARLLETRPGFPTIDSASAGAGAVAANSATQFVATGRGGIPGSGVGAVALNVTVTGPALDGYLTVYPTGAARPTASNLNFVPGLTIPNMVIVPLGAGGQVSVFNGSGGTVNVVVDVLGWFPTGSAFTGLTSSRLADTRVGAPTVDAKYSGYGAVAPQDEFSLDSTVFNLVVAGRGGVPAADVGAVALNVTVTGPTAAGFLTVYPAGTHRPTASNLNFTPGQSIPNMVIVPLGNAGQISIYNSAGATDVIVDVLGWFPNPTAPPTVYGNTLTLGSSSLGSLPFGSAPAPVISAATSLWGAPTVDFSEEFTLFSDGSGRFYNDDTGDSYTYRFGRQLCYGSRLRPFCIAFGGATAGALSFTGWTYYGDEQGLMFDSNGVGFGSRASDFPFAINYEPGGCINTGSGSTATGIRLYLIAHGADFASFVGPDYTYVPLLPPASTVYVAGMNAGESITAEGDC